MQKPVVVTILVGPSGSGKSTYARELVDNDPRQKTVRVNRDDIRSMLHLQVGRGKPSIERHVVTLQQESILTFIDAGYNVVVDDTNLNPKTVENVKVWAKVAGARVVVHEMNTPLRECIRLDSLREGKARVGRAVIERQFLAAGMFKHMTELDYDGNGPSPIVIVDIDGTLAQNTVNRSPYDESRVLLDPVYEDVKGWVNDLFWGRECEGNPNGLGHYVLLVSGRHSTCGPDTVKWLKENGICFDHIFMRHGWDNRADTIVKSEILDELLRNVPKEQIAFVIDDRPSVLNMWHSRGLKIYPAREIKEPF